MYTNAFEWIKFIKTKWIDSYSAPKIESEINGICAEHCHVFSLENQ